MKMPHDVMVSLATDVGADWDIDYDLEMGLKVDLPLIKNFTIPITSKGEIRLPTLSDPSFPMTNESGINLPTLSSFPKKWKKNYACIRLELCFALYFQLLLLKAGRTTASYAYGYMV